MKKFSTVLTIATLLAAPALCLTADASPQATTGSTAKSKTATAPAKPAAVATHATKGVITSVTDTTLVISRPNAKDKKSVTFALNSSTQRKGDLIVGASVDVRYRTEGANNVATAVKIGRAHV